MSPPPLPPPLKANISQLRYGLPAPTRHALAALSHLIEVNNTV